MTAMTSSLHDTSARVLAKSQLTRLVIEVAVAAAISESLLYILDLPSSPKSPSSPTVETMAAPVTLDVEVASQATGAADVL